MTSNNMEGGGIKRWGNFQGKTDVRTVFRLVKNFRKNRLTLFMDGPQCKNIGLTRTWPEFSQSSQLQSYVLPKFQVFSTQGLEENFNFGSGQLQLLRKFKSGSRQSWQFQVNSSQAFSTFFTTLLSTQIDHRLSVDTMGVRNDPVLKPSRY